MSRLAFALKRIKECRDHHAESGKYPPPPNGPGPDQAFDDWAADVAQKALEPEDGIPHSLKQHLITTARELYANNSNDDIEVDDNADFSVADDGIWVQGWLWVAGMVCGKCWEPYKEDEGFSGLCQKCADKTQPCGDCGETPKNEADYTSITDHGRCVECHKKWQHGEVCPNCEGSGRTSCPLCDGTGKAFPEES